MEKHGLSLTDAARAIEKSYKAVYSWKSRGSGAKQEHIHKLIETFPVQLTAKAKELGIEVPSLATQISGMTVADLAGKSKEELLLTVIKLQQQIEMLRDQVVEQDSSHSIQLDELGEKANRIKGKLSK